MALKDGEQVVKVLDFGIVKETSKNDADEAAGATETGVMMGSVHYMSPEQIRSSRQVDHRSDLWSVAVIVYKMLTGNAPFPGTNTGDVMVRVCTDSCAPPSSVVAGLSRAVDAFFERAFTREPAGRFQSAQEMADAFVTTLSASPSTSNAAKPPPQKWAKTLPLMGNDAGLRAAIEMASGTPGQSQRPPQPSVYPNGTIVSATPEATPGTFQAVTMPHAQLMAAPGTAIAVPKSSTNLSKGVVLGVGFAVVVIGLSVGIFVMQKGSGPDEPGQAAPAAPASLAAPVENLVVPLAPAATSSPASSASASVSSASVSGTMPAPRTTLSSIPLQPAKTTAPATTAPKSAPSPRQNPLDIND